MGQDLRKLELGSVSHQSGDLSLVVYDRPLHPELFRLYAEYRVRQTRYHADIWIIGLGHLVTVTSGSRSMTELIAVENEHLPTRGVLTRFRLKGERDLDRAGPDGWNYMASTQIEVMDEPLYKSVHTDLVRHASKRARLQLYEHMGSGELVPFSYLDHEARDREFHVHAFHAFPAEHAIVKTQTIFELPA